MNRIACPACGYEQDAPAPPGVFDCRRCRRGVAVVAEGPLLLADDEPLDAVPVRPKRRTRPGVRALREELPPNAAMFSAPVLFVDRAPNRVIDRVVGRVCSLVCLAVVVCVVGYGAITMTSMVMRGESLHGTQTVRRTQYGTTVTHSGPIYLSVGVVALPFMIGAVGFHLLLTVARKGRPATRLWLCPEGIVWEEDQVVRAAGWCEFREVFVALRHTTVWLEGWLGGSRVGEYDECDLSMTGPDGHRFQRSASDDKYFGV